MVAAKDLIDVIKSYKKWDIHSAEMVVARIIKKLEKSKRYKVAKELRAIYAKPYANRDMWNTIGSSNFTPYTSGNSWVTQKSDLYDLRKPKIDLENIILSEHNMDIVKEISANYEHKNLFYDHDLDIKTRILLYWPPWTWKTLFAYSLAWELWLPVMHVWLDQLISSYLGETWKNIRKIFDDASKSNCIIFLDEFDAVAKHRDDQAELWELKRVVTVLLQYIDNLNPNNILISATNHFQLLDSAIVRRFEYQINLWLLDKDALAKLYSIYLKNQLLDEQDFNYLAWFSQWMSWALIKQVIDKWIKKWIIEAKQNENELMKYLSIELLVNQLKLFSEDQKMNKEKIIIYIKEIQSITDKFSYKDFENITGVPNSTLHDWLNK